MKKRTLLAVPLSMSLLVPTAAFANDHEGKAAETNADTSVSTPASELRSALGHLFTEHAFLAVETMKKGADGTEDFEALAGELNKNTEDLTAAVTSVYGEEGGAQFNEMWSSHIGFFVDYVKATGAKDQAGKDKALEALGGYVTEQAAFLESATEGRLKAADLEPGLKMHIDQLIWAFDSYVAGDYETGYMNERESIKHMSMVAAGLATAITDQFPDKFENTMAVTPAADLRASLEQVFTEHAGLAVMAMQNGVDGDPDFDASAAALLANADDLSAAVGSVYGEEGGEAFDAIWKSHIGYFVDYVTATANDDQAGKDQAMKELEGYVVEQAAFLESATEGGLPAADLEAGLTEHVTQLIAAFDQYVAGDFEGSYASLRESYAHMLMPGSGLAQVIINQFPEKFSGQSMPDGMPKTGMGGTADQDGMPYEWFLLGGLLVAAIGGAFALRKASNEA